MNITREQAKRQAQVNAQRGVSAEYAAALDQYRLAIESVDGALGEDTAMRIITLMVAWEKVGEQL
jgi:hypothetical protein